MEYAAIMRDSSPMVVRSIKRFVRDTVVQRGPSELSALAQRELLSISRGEDQQEGGHAFKEKRKPVFKEDWNKPPLR
jgi:enoyl-CoA hydratase